MKIIFSEIQDNEECRKTLPVIDDVALRYNGNDSVVIATMDVSKNDGEIDVYFEFPSFKFFTADNKVSSASKIQLNMDNANVYTQSCRC